MAVIVSDSFNRADSSTTLGVADTGQTWQVGGTATFGVINSQGYAATSTMDNTGAFINVAQTVRDYTLTVKVPTMQSSSTNLFRLYPRVALNGSLLYYIGLEAFSGGYRVAKRASNGGITTLATTSVVPANGDIIKVDHFVSGQMDFYINGTKITTVTDTDMLAVAYGIGFGGKQSPTYRVDDFLVEDLATGTPTGTPGSATYATKQVLTLTSSLLAATKQSLYQTGSIAYATQQNITDGGIPGSVRYATKQVIRLTSSVPFATKQAIWRAGSSQWATMQNIMDFVTVIGRVNLQGEHITSISLAADMDRTVSLQGSTNPPSVALEGEL